MLEGFPEPPDLSRSVTALFQQKATAAEVDTVMRFLRMRWLGEAVPPFFAALAVLGPRHPALVFSGWIASLYGPDYFLPPPPELLPEDDRLVSDAIAADFADSGKETLFASNLQKAFKQAKQARGPLSQGQSQGVPTAAASGGPAATKKQAGGGRAAAAAGPPTTLEMLARENEAVALELLSMLPPGSAGTAAAATAAAATAVAASAVAAANSSATPVPPTAAAAPAPSASTVVSAAMLPDPPGPFRPSASAPYTSACNCVGPQHTSRCARRFG